MRRAAHIMLHCLYRQCILWQNAAAALLRLGHAYYIPANGWQAPDCYYAAAVHIPDLALWMQAFKHPARTS